MQLVTNSVLNLCQECPVTNIEHDSKCTHKDKEHFDICKHTNQNNIHSVNKSFISSC